MNKATKINILIIAAVIVLVVNMSVLGTILYKLYVNPIQHERPEFLCQTGEAPPAHGFGRFLRNELNLSPSQAQKFAQFRKRYHKRANKISMELEHERIVMIDALNDPQPDMEGLDSIAQNIGKLHTGLKRETIKFYIELKSECNEEQKKILAEVFHALTNYPGDFTFSKRKFRQCRRQMRQLQHN